MVIDNKKYQTYLQILKEELVPAMGCTEPIALAYCASKARDVLNAVPTHCLVEVSGNIIKNVKSVIVPNTHSLKGIEAAVAAGIIAGKTDRILEVIADVKKEQISKIEEYLAKDCIEIKPLDSDHILDIKITLFNNNDKVVVRIVDQHTNIILIEKNDEKIFVKDENCKCQKENNNRDCLNVADIYEFANTVKIDDIKATIERQINYNSAIAKEGLENDYGANIGSVLLKTGDDIAIKAKAMAAAGSEAGMSVPQSGPF